MLEKQYLYTFVEGFVKIERYSVSVFELFLLFFIHKCLLRL